MKKILLTTILSVITFCLLQAQVGDLYINEFLASNDTDITDEVGEFEDWVEIYNAGSSSIDMGGMYFTDDLTNPTLYQIPTTDPGATTIGAGEYLIFFFDKDLDQGILHIDAKLGAGGEAIGLYASDGTTEIDSYTFGIQLADISEGRDPDAGATWAFFTSTTPGETNDNSTGTSVTEPPVADIGGGMYTGSVTVILTSATPGATIYYTLDGSLPDEDDDEYNGSFLVDENTVIRAIADASGFDPSPVMTHTYLIDVDHDFVVVTMTTDPDNLYNSDDGLFIKVEEDLEKPAHIQFFEPDGSLAFAQDIEIELHGKGSVSLPQKSLKIKAKASFGNEFFEHAIFPEQEFDAYRSFVVRQSGQDWNKTMFRDAFMQGLMNDVTDLGGLLPRPDLDGQAYRPAILYINGQYWGIQNVREQMNWKYVNTHYGIDKDEVDVVEDIDELKTGDLVEWTAFNEFLENNNFSGDANYQLLREKADIDHFIDYMLHGIILDNNDWPGNNNRHWRERTPEGKWRYLSKDFDFGFGLRPINSDWNSGDFTTDMIAICLAEDSDEYYNREEATLFLRRLMENDDARTYFINRGADLLNTAFTEDRMIARIDSFETLYIPEMQEHFDMWQSGWNGHATNVNKLRTFAGGRTDEVRGHFQGNFSEVTGMSTVTVDANPSDGGVVQFNTLNVSESFFPWEGIYFRGLEIPTTAIPNRGYFFDDWSGSATGTNSTVLVDINSSSETVTANFTLGSTATDPIVINEINYNSPDAPDPADWVELHNPTNAAVDISGWYFEDESGEYYGFPENTIMAAGSFLLLVEDEAEFMAIYPNAVNVFGSFGVGDAAFGLSGKGELVTLKNAAGILIDEVEFDDSAPWPESPDGDGPTLQLIDPVLDNALPESWIGVEATPGATNAAGLLLSCPDAIEVFVIPGSTHATVSWNVPAPTTSCATGTITLTQTGGPVNGSIVPLGTSTVTYEASDDCGNIETCSFDITVTVDAGELTVNCLADITENTAPGENTVIVNWLAPTATTTCPEGNATVVQTVGPAPGSSLSEGMTTISYSVTDLCGNTSVCSFIITVNVTPTSISLDCPASLFLNAEPGAGGATATWDIPMPSTTCPSGSINLVITGGSTSGSFFPVGITDITYQTTDDCGNLETCSFQVTVVDVPSMITTNCPGNITASSETGTGEIIGWPTPAATTDCALGGITSTVQTGGLPSGSFFPIGEYTISYEFMDACGATATCSFLVKVVDGTGSVTMDCPDDISIVLGVGQTETEVNWSAPSISTTCGGGGGNPNCGTPIPGFSFLGSYNDHEYYISNDKVKWEDADVICQGYDGYLASVTSLAENTFLANSLDVKAFIGLHDSNTEGVFEWANGETYNYSELPAGINTDANDFAYIKPWDEAWGLYADYIPKYFVMELECAGGGGLQLSQTGGPSSGDDLTAGTYTVTYEGTDACGDVETCSFTVTVENNAQSLVIDCPNDITITETAGAGGAIVNWADATATSTNCAGVINIVQTQGNSSGSLFSIGTYTIVYEAIDACMNVETCSFTVTVIADTPSSDYCESEGSSPWNEHIKVVTFGAINNESAKEGYGDFTDLSTTVVEGETYPMSILPKFSWTQYDEYFQVWIDFNHDFDFNDPGELVMVVIRIGGASGSTVDPILGNIEIPNGVVGGSTRMRISMKRDAYADPCEFFENGEVEDYTVVLQTNGPTLMGTINKDMNAVGQRNAEMDASSTASFNLYPNPARTHLSIDMSMLEEVYTQVEMYNSSGQLMMTQALADKANDILVVDVSDFGRGLYMVSLVNAEGERVTKQVVVE